MWMKRLSLVLVVALGLSPACATDLSGPDGGCVPKSCTDLQKNCGALSDGCGGTINCGTCSPPMACGGGGIPNVCGQGVCNPETDAAFCQRFSATCGVIANLDNCGVQRSVNCGSCPAGDACDAAHQCVFASSDAGTGAHDSGFTLPDGGFTLPDGGFTLPDGGLTLPDGGIVLPDAGFVPCSAGCVCTNGATCLDLSQTGQCPNSLAFCL